MEKRLSEKEIDYIVGNVAASFSFEGMDIPEDEQEIAREILRGNLSVEEYIAQVKEEYMVKD